MKNYMVKKFAVVMLAAVVLIVCSGSAFAAEPTKVGAQAYTPDSDEAKYISEMVSAKLLTSDVYNKAFYDYLTRVDFAAFVMTYYYYLGGQDPGGSGGNFTDTTDPNADKGYLLGFFSNDDGYFYPDNYVSRGEALTVLAKATVKANPAESSNVPTAEAALAALAQIYQDAAYIDAESLSYIGFMNARGALLMPRGEQPGRAWIGAGNSVSRGDFFLYLSDAAWIFARSKLSPHSIKPDVPTASEYQRDYISCYKNNTSLYWNEAQGAYSYGVSLYVSKKLKKKLSVGYSSLYLNKTSTPTYKSVFGNLKQKKVCYLKVQTVDRHGVKSKKALKVNFYAEKFVNVNEKIFGNKNRFGFKNAKAAKKYQKTIKVKVWKLSGGKKVKSSMWLTVNKEIADDVKKIFAEIYKGKEKFPIKDMGGFQIRSSKTSEHNHGTAIDINANENYMITGDKVDAGSFWKPGKNPYSIPAGGDVVKAFEKYGWYWGGNGWGDRKDYMHFSYFHG